MPTGLRNVVCDECSGGRIAYLATGEIQLEHDDNCMYKYREDTFLISLCQELFNQNPLGSNVIGIYPKEAKLNPIIYDMYCEGYYARDKELPRGVNAKERADKINEWLQIIKIAIKKDEENNVSR